MANKTLKPLRYQIVAVTDALGDNFYVDPFDANGNLLPEMTILVDTSLAIGSVYLPSIIGLNYDWNIKVNVVALSGSAFDCQVYGDTTNFDTIGSQPRIAITTDGGNAECTIVSDTIWSALITA
jgi:hypothetical protein